MKAGCPACVKHTIKLPLRQGELTLHQPTDAMLTLVLREKMKTLSRHSELTKAFAYALNQWPTLTYYADDGWAEADNNIAENALRTVSVGRINFLFFGPDHGGERGTLLYSLIGTCKLNSVDPEIYLRYELDVIDDWPVNRVSELLSFSIKK
ncbi:IS66 family transposase [Yersinia ruckeri]|uniref:IS66 family transposase n=1 Tax=Yersinia ruckeri TaxID=29486 RepID=UPI003B75BE14